MTRQCQLLAVPRSSVYARPQDVSKADLELMRQIDELYLKWPFYGSRRLCDELRQRGYAGQSQTRTTPDAADGAPGRVSEAAYQSTRARGIKSIPTY